MNVLLSLGILLGCTGMGFLKSLELYFRVSDIRQYQEYLYHLQREILYIHVPLEEAILTELQHGKGKTKIQRFQCSFKHRIQDHNWNSFSEIWQEVCDCDIDDRELRDIWLRMGRQLGKGNTSHQKQVLDHCSSELERLEQRAFQTFCLQGKMYSSLGICFGLFLTVLFL